MNSSSLKLYLKPYFRLFLKCSFVILIYSLLIQRVTTIDTDNDDALDDSAATTNLYNDEIVNSLPRMPPVEEETKPKAKLQIGIKKRAEDCTRKAQKGDSLHMHYRGSLKSNGAEFDNSYKRGQPLIFTLGTGQVIKGWDQGLLGICAGEKRKLVIPPQLAYGDAGSPPTIPPDSTLVFEVEAIKIEDRSRADL